MRKKAYGIFGLSLALCAMAVMLLPMAAFAEGEEYVPAMYQTFWSLVPPIVAIGLALITKEVYSSLFIGILVGALFYSDFAFEGTILHLVNDGFLAVLTDGDNMGIVIFLVILGAMVCLMNRAGGSAAFGRWTADKIKGRVGAQLSTVFLGSMIFIDDYFNCLTVGSVMRPVTDKHYISRAKLAYLIDATAAPICIIAPISSWAAAVSGFVEGEDAISLFIQSIPYNFYALLTIVMMIGLAVMKIDFGPMAIHERNAVQGDLFTVKNAAYAEVKEEEVNQKGRVMDLVVPILALIVCCVIGMIYTGGFFSGVDFVTAFSDCSASQGLVFGSLFALAITIVFYVARRVLSFKDCMGCLPDGFKSMVPAILILSMAWSLKAMTDSLGAKYYVEALVKGASGSFISFLPAIVFLVGCFLAFATGTSWGTFGILIPIVVEAFRYDPTLMIISISACMAGAVCGDHCSPISDTTIMASAGAQCDHVTHVSTQLPYAISVASISFVLYLLAGFVKSAWICLPLGILLVLGFLFIIKKTQGHGAKISREPAVAFCGAVGMPVAAEGKADHGYALAKHFQQQAEMDLMTGVYNRTYFEQHMDKLLAEEASGYFYLIDLDDLKQYNDSKGHQYGDEMICALAEALKEIYGQGSCIGRIGGDEFAVYAAGELGSEQAIAKAEQIHTVLKAKGWDCSIGIVEVSPELRTFDKLYRKGDKALYFVKRNGKGGSHFFSAELEQ